MFTADTYLYLTFLGVLMILGGFIANEINGVRQIRKNYNADE